MLNVLKEKLHLTLISALIVMVIGCIVLLVYSVQRAPERQTSVERVLTQPERETSIERMHGREIELLSSVSDNQLDALKTSEIEQTRRMSNYYTAKAELSSEWVIKFAELKKKYADQATINLAFVELKSAVQAKYLISLDSEPVATSPELAHPIQPTRQIPQPVVSRQNGAKFGQLQTQYEIKRSAIEQHIRKLVGSGVIQSSRLDRPLAPYFNGVTPRYINSRGREMDFTSFHAENRGGYWKIYISPETWRAADR